MSQYSQRIQKLREKMLQNQQSDSIIADPSSIYYFTGYRTDPGERLFVFKVSASGQDQLYVNKLFPEPKLADDIRSHIEIVEYQDGEPVIVTLALSLGQGSTGIDKLWPSHFLLELASAKADLAPVNGSKLVDELRSIKETSEINTMIEASQLNDQVMEATFQHLSHGLSEAEVGEFVIQQYKDTGHTGPSFDPIIAYGANGADPHHTTDQTLPKLGDSIVIDIGGQYQGYASDMTRTVFYGDVSEEARHIYNVVKEANETAIELVQPGRKFSEIDLAARHIIEEAGYGEYFTHRLGHFIGQDVHEAGDVSQFNQDTIQVGQIFSIEPGIYLPGKLGVRIEDLVLVVEGGVKVLNQVPKDLHIIQPVD